MNKYERANYLLKYNYGTGGGAGAGPWRGTQALKAPFPKMAASQNVTVSYYNSAQQAPPNPILNQDPLLAFKKLEPGLAALRNVGVA